MKDCHSIDDALRMYAAGANIDTVAMVTGIRLESAQIPEETRRLHLKCRNNGKYMDAWDKTRKQLRNRRYDLSRIILVEGK